MKMEMVKTRGCEAPSTRPVHAERGQDRQQHDQRGEGEDARRRHSELAAAVYVSLSLLLINWLSTHAQLTVE